MKGIIVKGISGLYYVKCNDVIIKCKARGKFRHKYLVPMVGDYVEIDVKNNEGIIEEINDRKNKLIRPPVSNVTQALVFTTIINPELNLNLLNKFLILCQSKKIKLIVCINKIDMIDKNDGIFLNLKSMLNNCGYETILLSAKSGIGVERLKEKLSNEVTVFCGPSGVGKSTLFNKLLGHNIMETGEISSKLKRGKNTTRHCELIEFNNGFLVDTPGFSSLDITFIKRSELQNYFPEFQQFIGECKFTDCIHDKEIKCAIKNAVRNGKITNDRYDFYISTLKELTKINK